MLDLSRQKVDGFGGIIVLPGLLLVGATLWFVYVYRSRFSRRALLRSNLPRDNWMRATKRRLPTPGRPKTSPANSSGPDHVSEPSHALKTFRPMHKNHPETQKPSL